MCISPDELERAKTVTLHGSIIQCELKPPTVPRRRLQFGSGIRPRQLKCILASAFKAVLSKESSANF